MDNNEKVIENAQYRKGLSIAFFNATNNAIEIVKMAYPNTIASASIDETKVAIAHWRDWLLEEHKSYYATVIAQVGKNFKPEDTIKRLESATTLQELAFIWRSLSEDERQNEEVAMAKDDLKAKYETN